jgi:hypothetical protein
MITQTTLDLVTKLPFSEVPRLGGKTRPIKQTEIQAEGCFKQGDPHPLYEGLVFRCKRKGRGQRWITKEEFESEKLKARDYEKNNKHVRQAYNERNAERISKKAAQYYKDNWDAKNEYRKKHRERTRANVNRNYANNKAPYIARRNARRKQLKENIKLNKTQRAELNELHRLRLELDLAAVGAGMFPEGHNKQGRWAFEVHHLMPLTENKEVYLGLDAAWNVEILSVAEHKKAHSRASPSEC